MNRRAIRGAIAVVISLAVPGLSWADLTNTASVSYQDASGTPYNATSNTVTVIVGGGLLQPPVINGFMPFNYYLQSSDSLSVILAGGAPAQLNWIFTSQTPSSVTPGVAQTASVGQPVSTAVPSLTLSAVSQLIPGPWQVTVTAVNSAGSSAPATANFILVTNGLSGVRIYPNPWRSDKHQGTPITFDHLPPGSASKIFTLSGHLVKTLSGASDTVTWDLTNDPGDHVASGLYLYLINSPEGQMTRGTLAVIR